LLERIYRQSLAIPFLKNLRNGESVILQFLNSQLILLI